ncbi:MAG: sigma-70 family RNA polymerase sigma factor, partial [Butyricicoccus sp.]
KKDRMTNEQLCALAKQGDADAQNLLIEKNLCYIKKSAYEVWNTRAQFNRSLCIDVEDLVQEGSMGLYDCIEKFDSDSGNQFLTYAVPAIKNAMLDYVRLQSSSFEGKNQSEIVSLDELAKDEEQSRHTFIPDPATQTPEQVYLAQERLNDLHHALDRIESREEQYLRYRFGFDDDVEHPLAETAKHFHLSGSRAKHTEALALDNVWLELPWWYEQRRTFLLSSIIEALLAIEN